LVLATETTTYFISNLLIKKHIEFINFINMSILANLEDDQPVIDVIDAYCPSVLEKYYYMLPPAEKAAAASTSNIDLQWIVDRSSCVWTAGNLIVQ
jgi:hypothetical protein